MISWRANQTVVRRLRVKGRKLDSLAAQLRLENLLQMADLHPMWLPASAVVCLRKVRDPLPRTLKLQSRTPTHSLVWQQAISAAVAEKVRRAARPINGEPPGEATAVIFKDQAELLACLTMDWANHRVNSRWWWRSLFKGKNLETLVFDEWLRTPQFVPSAVELLSLQRGIEPFARKLSREQAKTLLLAITDCFDLPQLQTAIVEGFAYLNQTPAAERATRKPLGGLSDLPGVAPPSTPPTPWRFPAGHSLNQLPEPEQKCLIGVALTIRRASAAARSAVFARETLAWLRAAAVQEFAETRNPVVVSKQNLQKELVESNGDRGVSPTEGLVVDGHIELHLSKPPAAPLKNGAARERFEARPSPNETTRTQRKVVSKELSDDVNTSTQESWSSEVDLTEEPEAKPAMLAQREPPGRDRPVTLLPTANAPGPAQSIADRSETVLSSRDQQLVALPESNLLATDEYRIETKLGGLFYLINLGLFLELYSDFTKPAQKGLALSIFDFLTLIGRRLLNDTIGDDPVWELLAKLAGRHEMDDSKEGFEPPDEWRLPAQWLEAFPDENQFEWNSDGQRLRVKHPAGFMVLDVQLRDRPAKQMHQEMKVYAASAKRVTKRERFDFSRSDSRLAQWLDWIMPYIRVRLCRALGISDTSDPGPSLCVQNGKIVLTDVHLDIFFALAEHPLELRLAGLDRDPGWVPAAGRFVRFHYR